MLSSTIKFCTFKRMFTYTSHKQVLKRNYLVNKHVLGQNKRETHPYNCIHPWNSLENFANDLLNNIIYDKDGLLVLNKPYGIALGNGSSKLKDNSTMANAVHYTIKDALPHICNQLKYPELTIVKAPEKYMSGITLLATNSKIVEAIRCAYNHHAFCGNNYWIITIDFPLTPEKSHYLGLKSISQPKMEKKKNVLVTKWSKNEEKRGEVNIFRCVHKVLAKSIFDLCTLTQLTAHHHKKHVIRLFSATQLYSPILGDNIYSSRVKRVGDSYVQVDPFFSQHSLPKLDERLFQLLDLSEKQQEIIPAHIHLKSTMLPQFLGKNLTLEATLSPVFQWTCEQLQLKYDR